MEKVLQITKAQIAKIWHVLKAKAIATLEKYASLSTFAHDYWDFLGKIMVIKFLLVTELL